MLAIDMDSLTARIVDTLLLEPDPALAVALLEAALPVLDELAPEGVPDAETADAAETLAVAVLLALPRDMATEVAPRLLMALSAPDAPVRQALAVRFADLVGQDPEDMAATAVRLEAVTVPAGTGPGLDSLPKPTETVPTADRMLTLLELLTPKEPPVTEPPPATPTAPDPVPEPQPEPTPEPDPEPTPDPDPEPDPDFDFGWTPDPNGDLEAQWEAFYYAVLAVAPSLTLPELYALWYAVWEHVTDGEVPPITVEPPPPEEPPVIIVMPPAGGGGGGGSGGPSTPVPVPVPAPGGGGGGGGGGGYVPPTSPS